MNKALGLALIVAAWWFPLGQAELSADEVAPFWIWGDWHDTQLTFSKSFTVTESVQQATLKFAADFCQARVKLNGRAVLTVESFCQTQQIDVTPFMVLGENTVVIQTDSSNANLGGFSFPISEIGAIRAVALSIDLIDRNGRTSVISDSRWSAKRGNQRIRTLELGRVRPQLWGIGRRQATISPLENYEQWRQAGGATAVTQPKFWTVPDFEISQLQAATADDGSWIAMAFDPQGRLTISREDKGLLRLTLDDNHKVTNFERIDADLKECRGLTYYGDYLYANANNSKGMFCLKIADDGGIDDMQLLREFPGEVGHGRNDLTFHHNSETVYSIHGDAVLPPGVPILDLTSPLRDSRRVKQRKEGYVVSYDLYYSEWKLICTGLRNPYGIASGPPFGDLFTYDADNEFDMGTPWYRPTRIVQIQSGADYGYHPANGEWPPRFHDQPDNALPLIDVGRGSPTAVMFGSDLKFPQPYRDALFVLDWTYGRVLAVHLAPRGGGYRAALELFLQGMPLNVTDIAAGPDGAMYLITGGRKTQSALYRVAYKGKIEVEDTREKNAVASETKPAWMVAEPHEGDCAHWASRRLAMRWSLENQHRGSQLEELDDYHTSLRLGSDDPIMRHAIRVAFEKFPVEQLHARGKKPFGSLATLNDEPIVQRKEFLNLFFDWCTILVRTGEAEPSAEVAAKLLTLTKDDLDLGQRLFVVFLYRRCMENAPDAVANQRKDIIDQLLKIWPDLESGGLGVSPYGTNHELRRRIAILLGDLQATEAVAKIVDELLASPVQEDRLAGLLALRNQREGWTSDLRRKYFAALNEGTKFVGGEGMPQFIGRIRSDALATLSEREVKELADVLNPPPPVVEPPPKPRPVVQRWALADLNSLYADTNVKGDAVRGATVFRDALCARCHRAGLTGPAVGPELTFVARRFSRRDMLESILTPGLSVAENYCNTQVTTEAGKIYVGRLLNEGDFRSEKLKINVDPLRPSEIVEIDKKDIAEHFLTATSPMPQGLLDSFTQQEIADLLAYLEAGGTAMSPQTAP